jgi:hypothetical protein
LVKLYFEKGSSVIARRIIAILLVAWFVLFSAAGLSGCSLLVAPEQSPWLADFIASIEDEPYYGLAAIHSYHWRGQIYFEVVNPLSSCAHCEVYTFSGEQVEWGPNLSQEDYVQHRQGGEIMWQARP